MVKPGRSVPSPSCVLTTVIYLVLLLAAGSQLDNRKQNKKVLDTKERSLFRGRVGGAGREVKVQFSSL